MSKFTSAFCSFVIFLTLFLAPASVYAQSWDTLLERAKNLQEADPIEWVSVILLIKQARSQLDLENAPADTAVAKCLFELAVSYFNTRKNVSAALLFDSVVTLSRESERPYLSEFLMSRVYRGYLYYTESAYDSARQLYVEAEKLAQSCGEPCLGDLGRIETQIANYYVELRQVDKAESYALDALRILRKEWGPSHSRVALALNTLGIVYDEMGNFDMAESAYINASKIYEKYPKDGNRAANLGSIGWLYILKGRFPEALTYLEDAYSIVTEQEVSTYVTARVTIGLARVKLYFGYDDEAKKLTDNAMRILGSDVGSKPTITVAEALQVLALAYISRGEFTLGEQALAESLNISKELNLDQSSGAADAWSLMGKSIALRGNKREATAVLKKALAIYALNIKKGSIRLLPALVNLAELYDDLADGASSAEAYDQVLQLIDSSPHDTSYHVATALESLAQYYRSQKKFDFALDFCMKAFAIRSSDIQKRLLQMPEPLAMSYAEATRQTVNLILSITNEQGKMSGELQKTLADAVLAVKGKATDALLAGKRIEKFGKQLDVSLPIITSSTVMDNLQFTGTLLVEYYQYEFLNRSGQAMYSKYLAVVVDDSRNLRVIDLGLAAPIDSLVMSYYNHMNAIAAQSYNPTPEQKKEFAGISIELSKLIWNPLQIDATSPELIILAPDAGLNLLSFAGLTADGKRYLIEDVPLHYVFSGRHLALDHQGKTNRGLLAMGNPVLSNIAIAQAEKSDQPQRSLPDCADFSSLNLAPLEFTEKELGWIKESWNKQNPSEVVDIYLGASASEANFKRLAPGYRAIHLATHGYFFQPNCEPYRLEKVIDDPVEYFESNPLLLSGLLLSNSPPGSDSDGAVEDGVLTAEEISQMDLRGVEIVALSACETGIGDIRAGEGVFGLRRAFRSAGVRTIVSSLWSVPDEQTSFLMGELYSHRKQARQIPLTLQELQIERIQKLRKIGATDHPFSWGAFISIGAWR